MSYRHRILRNLIYGSLPEFTLLQKEKNTLLAEAGLVPYAMWAPAFGGMHHMELEADFATMAAFEAQHEATKAIGRIGAINARQLELTIAGTASDRLLRLGLIG